MAGTTPDKCKLPAALWRALEANGIAPSAVLKLARLPATLHLSDRAVVTTDQYFSLWRALEEITGTSELGIQMVAATPASAHPPSSLAAFHARDFRDGLERLSRFKRLCTPERIQVEIKGADAIITVDWPHATTPEPLTCTDITFATVLELGRRGTGRPLIARAVRYAQADVPTPPRKDFYGAEVWTGMDRSALVLDRADLDRVFPGHNPELLAILTPSLAASLDELDAGSSILDQVKAVLGPMLASGRPELAGVASELGLSARTLQRRITEAGTSFRDLVADARRDLSHRLLADPSTDIDETAYLLGFQDVTSFYRAFRDWEGVPPGEWRSQRSLT
jgi:AraC-like DNA-binding protein